MFHPHSFIMRVLFMTLNLSPEDISTIVTCANTYNNTLCNKNFLFVYRNGAKQEKIEVSFYSRNYAHLTGINLLNMKVNLFYKQCINSKLNIKNLQLSQDGTTRLKLSILKNLICKDLSAKMICIYDRYRLKLYTDILVGNINGCIGFVKDKNGIFVPNT